MCTYSREQRHTYIIAFWHGNAPYPLYNIYYELLETYILIYGPTHFFFKRKHLKYSNYVLPIQAFHIMQQGIDICREPAGR